MIKLAILKPELCYGPEIYALHNIILKSFTSEISSEVIDYQSFLKRQNDFDIVYRMMGYSPMIFNSIDIPEIHDYASISTGKFIGLKNFIKRNFQKKPVFRTFLNQNVMTVFNFRDNVPFGFRDMGVNESFFDTYDFDFFGKKFDFCYVGDISKERGIDSLIEFFKKTKLKVLLIGDNKLGLNDCENIVFKGRVNNDEIPHLMNQSRFAINLVPDVYPYNIQTSTKLLEYLAINIPVLSNRNFWVEDFVIENNISLIFFDDFNALNKDFYSFYEERRSQSYCQVKKWEDVFLNSGLIDFLRNFKK
ncbi:MULTISPECIES: glycosyltransferase [unclassified Acinetobacter]|uniref:glycosyltransferase family protein n=1 Tax=unclassified Acinetobacter TaxID=196816 RepID=UPI0015D15D44|nr:MULTISPECIES: glycosyltransferase [unclassified Acinetobacter]UUS60883.1 glycosyltransferase [Acinetobacter sp. YH16056_T]